MRLTLAVSHWHASCMSRHASGTVQFPACQQSRLGLKDAAPLPGKTLSARLHVQESLPLGHATFGAEGGDLCRYAQ